MDEFRIKRKKFLTKFLPKMKRTAKRLSIPFIDIVMSPLKTKKYRIYLKDGAVIDFGHIDYEDYLEHNDDERRRKFFARFQNNKNIDNMHSAVFYITRLTW